MLAHQLAVKAGLRVAEADLQQSGSGHRTFMTRRFDRVSGTNGTQRIHFASAMTLLGHADPKRASKPPSEKKSDQS